MILYCHISIPDHYHHSLSCSAHISQKKREGRVFLSEKKLFIWKKRGFLSEKKGFLSKKKGFLSEKKNYSSQRKEDFSERELDSSQRGADFYSRSLTVLLCCTDLKEKRERFITQDVIRIYAAAGPANDIKLMSWFKLCHTHAKIWGCCVLGSLEWERFHPVGFIRNWVVWATLMTALKFKI